MWDGDFTHLLFCGFLLLSGLQKPRNWIMLSCVVWFMAYSVYYLSLWSSFLFAFWILIMYVVQYYVRPSPVVRSFCLFFLFLLAAYLCYTGPGEIPVRINQVLQSG